MHLLVKLLDQNSLVLRNKEECINIFVSFFEICQRRKFNNQFTFLVFINQS